MVGAVSFLTILPMAFVMIAGPQILSAIFFATSEDWTRNSLAYVGGAALSITLIVTPPQTLRSPITRVTGATPLLDGASQRHHLS